jgi:hypothetical protein
MDTRAADWQPFLLTANHCFSTQASATSLEATFDYNTLSCGGANNPNYVTVNGAGLLATNSQSDFTLVLLREEPPAPRSFLGWDAGSLPNNETMHAVHHPAGMRQKYSRHQNKTSPSFSCDGLSTSNFHYTYTLGGQTTGGSSGGNVVKSSGHVVGQLYGWCYLEGATECDYDDFYNVWGKFSVSYSNNNLGYWLYGGGSSVAMSTSPSSSLSYGTVNVGSTSSLNLTVNNIGTVPNYLNLEAGYATITGENAGDFVIVGTAYHYLPPANSGNITVRFQPSSPGMKTATLNIPHNADNIASPRTITLTGYGNPCSDVISLGGGGSANTKTFDVSGTGTWYTATNTPCGAPALSRHETATTASRLQAPTAPPLPICGNREPVPRQAGVASTTSVPPEPTDQCICRQVQPIISCWMINTLRPQPTLSIFSSTRAITLMPSAEPAQPMPKPIPVVAMAPGIQVQFQPADIYARAWSRYIASFHL